MTRTSCPLVKFQLRIKRAGETASLRVALLFGLFLIAFLAGATVSHGLAKRNRDSSVLQARIQELKRETKAARTVRAAIQTTVVILRPSEHHADGNVLQ